ncbi:MAG: CinA family protein [Candidatus Omnitrophica bacterium]|nr:CinA family protein [Candidatus Omnitrophota bacterium]
MERIVNQIHSLLIKRQKSVAVAESCTGGLLSELLTDLSGSSEYFILGIVAYSNAAKMRILNVLPRLIAKNGAVSGAVARKMARSVRSLAKSDFGLGITGIAGPTGGTPQKPIGTIFISIDGKTRSICKKFLFKGNRQTIRKKSALKALEMLKELIK